MKKLLSFILLCLLSTNLFAESAPTTDRTTEYILNRAYDSSTSTLKATIAGGSVINRTSAPDTGFSTLTQTLDANVGALKTTYIRSALANEIYFSLQAIAGNTGSATIGSGGHLGGVIGIGYDTAQGQLALYGVEGKVYGLGTAAGLVYAGILGNTNYIGAASSRNATSILTGLMADVYSYNNTSFASETNPGGIIAGVFSNQLHINDATNNTGYSFLGASNILQNNNDINMKKSNAQGYIQSFGTSGTNFTSIYHDNSNGFVTASVGNLIYTPGSGGSVVVGAGSLVPLAGTQALGISGNAWSQLALTPTTVASLGTASAGLIKAVSNAASATDCTSGGGSTYNLCMGNGSAWIDI